MYFPRTMGACWDAAGTQFPVLLLTGPRQVGKTTLLQHLCQEGRRYVTLDDPSVQALARDDPALFLQRFTPPVLIDRYADGCPKSSRMRAALAPVRSPPCAALIPSRS